MSSEQAAAVTQQSSTMTDEEKARVLELQRQINETEKAASAPNPGGSDEYLRQIPKESPAYRAYQSWLETTKEASKKLPELQSQYDQIVSSKPELKQYAKSHPATQYELHEAGESLFGASAFQTITHNHKVQPTTDAQKYARLRSFAEQNPNASIGEVVAQYQGSPLPQGNATIDYSSTLAARQAGLNVGSGIAVGLAETFEKDQAKRFAEHNQQINLTEGATNPLINRPTQPEPKPITPQNPRIQIERNNPNKLYVNPDFAQKGSDKYRGIKPQVQVLPSSLPSSSAEFRSGSFSLGQNNSAIIFGIAPEKPRQLSDAEFTKLSPSEQQNYLSQIDQWNQYVKYANEQNRQLLKGQKIVNQSAWEKNKAEILGYLAEEKKAGVKQVTILYQNAVKTVPIDVAFYNIMSTKDVKGILTAPVIPEGYSVAGVNLTGEGFTEYGNNPVGTLLLRKNEAENPVQNEKTAEEFWGGLVGKVGKRASEIASNPNAGPLAQTFAAAGQTGAEIAGGLIAIGGEIQRFKLPDIRKAAAELFNGTGTNGTETNSTVIPPGTITDRNLNVTENPVIPPNVTPPTAPGALVSGLSSAVMAAAVTRNPSLLVSGATEATKQFSAIAARQGLLPTVIQTALYVDPFNAGLVKAVPLKLERAEIPGVSASAKSIAFGYGTRTRPIITYTSEGKVLLGKPKFEEPITVEAVTPKQLLRGTKLAADSNALTQKVFTDVETIKKIKDITPEAIERARNINRIIELGSESKDVAKQGFGEQPFEHILPEETKSLMKSFKNQQDLLVGKLGPAEGSLSQIPYMLPGYVRKAGDFDFHVKKFETAANRARQTAREIIPSEGREFRPAIGLKNKNAHVELIKSGKRQKPSGLVPDYDETMWIGKEKSERITQGMNALESPNPNQIDVPRIKRQKVGEFLNEEETDESGMLQAIEGDTIFGKKIPEKAEKIEDVKTYGLQRQFVKKGESVFSLQKNEEGKLVLEPFKPRKLKDVSDFYAIGDTKAVNLLLAGKIEQALELGRELSQYKKNFSEVDIAEFFAKEQEAEPTTFGGGKSAIDQLAGNKALRQAGLSTGVKTPEIVSTSSEKKQTESFPYRMIQAEETKSLATRYVNRIPRGSYGRNTSKSLTMKPKSESLVSSSASIGQKLKSPGSISTGYSGKSPASLASAPKKSLGYSGKSSASLGYSGSPASRSPGPGSPNQKSPGSLPSPSPTSRSLLTPREGLPKELMPKPGGGNFPKLISKKNELRRKKEMKNTDFLGNAYENSITGLINRKEIKLGIKRTAKQERKDTAFVNKQKGRVKFVQQRNYTILSKKKQSILSRPSKKELAKIRKRSGGLF